MQENVRLKNRIVHALDINTFMDIDKTLLRINDDVHENNINNSYICPTRGLNYPGGRLAQRAVYDLMKDLFHIVEKGYEPIIRFSIFEFEKEYGILFNQCTDEQIKMLIYKN